MRLRQDRCSTVDVARILKDKQIELAIELDGDFARLLGISHPHLSLIYSGKRQPGRKVLLRMIELWPDVFNGGNRERHPEGDEHHGGADHGGGRDLDHPGVPGSEPCHRSLI